MAKQMTLFGIDEIPIENNDNKYSKKVSAPIYTPRAKDANLTLVTTNLKIFPSTIINHKNLFFSNGNR